MAPLDLPIDNQRPEPNSQGVPPDKDPNAPFEPPFSPGGPLGTAEAVINFFVRNNGLGEDPANSNHNFITAWYGVDGPWCAMTVSRALVESGFSSDGDTLLVPGVEQTTVKGWAFVPFVKRNFEDAGRFFTSNPQRGDLVIFDFEGDGEPDHIGVLEEDLGDGTFLTWEGNTPANLLERKRRSASIIAGFCRPPYGKEQEDDVDQETKQLIRDLHTYMSTVRKGDNGGPGLDKVEMQTQALLKDLTARVEAIEKRLS